VAVHFDDYYGHGVPDSIQDLACEFCGHRAQHMEREICGAIVCSDSGACDLRAEAMSAARRSRAGLLRAA
jgi:hypothetical protein